MPDDLVAAGPNFSQGMTKVQINIEWAVSLDWAIEMAVVDVIGLMKAAACIEIEATAVVS